MFFFWSRSNWMFY